MPVTTEIHETENTGAGNVPHYGNSRAPRQVRVISLQFLMVAEVDRK